MRNGLSGYRWVLLVRGVAAALFGIMALTWPAITLVVLVVFFGVYTFTDGILALYVGIRVRRDDERWWMIILRGLVGVGIGVLTFVSPGVTARALLYLIAAWAIITGVFETTAVIWLYRIIHAGWLWVLYGILALIIGVLLAAFPVPAVTVITWLIGICAIVLGALLIILAFAFRSLRHKFEREILGGY